MECWLVAKSCPFFQQLSLPLLGFDRPKKRTMERDDDAIIFDCLRLRLRWIKKEERRKMLVQLQNVDYSNFFRLSDRSIIRGR